MKFFILITLITFSISARELTRAEITVSSQIGLLSSLQPLFTTLLQEFDAAPDSRFPESDLFERVKNLESVSRRFLEINWSDKGVSIVPGIKQNLQEIVQLLNPSLRAEDVFKKTDQYNSVRERLRTITRYISDEIGNPKDVIKDSDSFRNAESLGVSFAFSAIADHLSRFDAEGGIDFGHRNRRFRNQLSRYLNSAFSTTQPTLKLAIENMNLVLSKYLNANPERPKGFTGRAFEKLFGTKDNSGVQLAGLRSEKVLIHGELDRVHESIPVNLIKDVNTSKFDSVLATYKKLVRSLETHQAQLQNYIDNYKQLELYQSIISRLELRMPELNEAKDQLRLWLNQMETEGFTNENMEKLVLLVPKLSVRSSQYDSSLYDLVTDRTDRAMSPLVQNEIANAIAMISKNAKDAVEYTKFNTTGVRRICRQYYGN